MKPKTKTIIPGKRCQIDRYHDLNIPCDKPASVQFKGYWLCSAHAEGLTPATPKTKVIAKRTCEWVDCDEPAVGQYRGTWLCEEHVNADYVMEEIDEIEDEEPAGE